MSSVTVDTLLASFGIVAGRTAAKGIVDNSQGFGARVDSAENSVVGGAHSQTSKPRNDGLDSHHCPAQNCYKSAPISSQDGPAIKMDPADHHKTASHGRGPDAREYRARQEALLREGKLLEAVQMDIDDIQSKFPGKYDRHLQQMLDYAKSLNPEDFIPGGVK